MHNYYFAIATKKFLTEEEPLEEILDDFSYAEGREKLEYLLEFSERLPALPEWLAEQRGDMKEVHECMTPVFVFGRPEADDKMVYYFDAPPESPTVRGFATILMEGVNGTSTAQQILDIDDLFYTKAGFQKVLTGQRMRGMSTFLMYMKRIAKEHVS